MSYASLSSQRGRTEMVGLLKQAREYAALGVICEVSGLEVCDDRSGKTRESAPSDPLS